MKTRAAVVEDLTSVLAMVEKLAEFHGDKATLTLEELRTLLEGESTWIKLLVAESDGQLVGYAALCPLIQLQWGLRGMDMHHLFVIESHRGKGVGKKLLRAAIEEAEQSGCKYLAVGTHPENAGAQQLYMKNGFEERIGGGPRFRLDL
jgi:GNAT superfamily N-acetyltransferase